MCECNVHLYPARNGNITWYTSIYTCGTMYIVKTLFLCTDLTISFSSPEFTVPEDGGPVEVCLTTSSVVAEDLTVVLLALESLPVDATGKKQTKLTSTMSPLHIRGHRWAGFHWW